MTTLVAMLLLCCFDLLWLDSAPSHADDLWTFSFFLFILVAFPLPVVFI